MAHPNSNGEPWPECQQCESLYWEEDKECEACGGLGNMPPTINGNENPYITESKAAGRGIVPQLQDLFQDTVYILAQDAIRRDSHGTC